MEAWRIDRRPMSLTNNNIIKTTRRFYLHDVSKYSALNPKGRPLYRIDFGPSTRRKGNMYPWDDEALALFITDKKLANIFFEDGGAGFNHGKRFKITIEQIDNRGARGETERRR